MFPSNLQPKQFQTPLPGLESVEPGKPMRKNVGPVDLDPRDYSGPAHGQLVMGVADLGGDAREKFADQAKPTTGSGLVKRGRPEATAGLPFYNTDKAGFIEEPQAGLRAPAEHEVGGVGRHTGAIKSLYGSIGGRFASTASEKVGDSAHAVDMSPGTYLRQVENLGTDEISDDEERVDRVRSAWESKPIHNVRSDTPIHTAQSWEETLHGADRADVAYGSVTDDENTEGRQRIRSIARALKGGKSMEPAWLLKMNNRLYSLDGHHRIEGARVAGQESYRARIWDADDREVESPWSAG